MKNKITTPPPAYPKSPHFQYFNLQIIDNSRVSEDNSPNLPASLSNKAEIGKLAAQQENHWCVTILCSLMKHLSYSCQR